MLITNDILIFIFNRWQPNYGPATSYEIQFPNTSSPHEPLPGPSRAHDIDGYTQDHPRPVPGPSHSHDIDGSTQDHPPGLDTSGDSVDTLITEVMYSCQSLTNGFAKQNSIGTSAPYREHTFLVEIRRNNISYAKCLFCTKEIDIEKHTMSNIFLSNYTHMACALYDEKIHILQDIETVDKIKQMKIQVRKILMAPNIETNRSNWDPSVITSVLKPIKKCRLLNLPHSE